MSVGLHYFFVVMLLALRFNKTILIYLRYIFSKHCMFLSLASYVCAWLSFGLSFPLPLGAAVLSTPVSCMQLSALLFFMY